MPPRVTSWPDGQQKFNKEINNEKEKIRNSVSVCDLLEDPAQNTLNFIDNVRWKDG